MSTRPPITDAQLHAYADDALSPEQAREVEAHLARHPEQAARVQAWRDQKRAMHALFDPVLDEPVPAPLLRQAQPRPRWQAWRLAAGVAIALLGGAAGWGLRGQWPTAQVAAAPAPAAFAQRAAVAHAVFAPDQRRPVEVDAAHEEQLVAWLSKRMGARMQPPQLQALGYALEGGRLLPGARGPVAQFMYADPRGRRLTLYVSDERGAGSAPAPTDKAFRFVREESVNVFYWIDGTFGYALSSEAERAELARVSAEVYRQIGRR